jgi:Mg2+ and Co2+ transporter CorA
MLVENKLARGCPPGITGEMVLMELLDAVIDRNADILERAGRDMDTISHAIFRARGPGAHRPRQAIFRHPDRDRPQGRSDLQGCVRAWSRSGGW